MRRTHVCTLRASKELKLVKSDQALRYGLIAILIVCATTAYFSDQRYPHNSLKALSIAMQMMFGLIILLRIVVAYLQRKENGLSQEEFALHRAGSSRNLLKQARKEIVICRVFIAAPFGIAGLAWNGSSVKKPLLAFLVFGIIFIPGAILGIKRARAMEKYARSRL